MKNMYTMCIVWSLNILNDNNSLIMKVIFVPNNEFFNKINSFLYFALLTGAGYQGLNWISI